MVYSLDPVQTLFAAFFVLFLGSALHRQFYSLRKFNIPEPVIGGIIVAIILMVLRSYFDLYIWRNTSVQDDLMYAFFATVGLNAKVSLFKQGRRSIVVFLLISTAFLFFQNLIGVGAAKLMGLHPFVGLLAGSMTLSGGHATGASFAAQFGGQVEGAMEIALACATLGLVLGGILGGPVAQRLIAQHNLLPSAKVNDPDEALKGHGFDEPETVTAFSVSQVLALTLCAMALGELLDRSITFERILIPHIIWVLFSAILLTNLASLSPRSELQSQSIDLVNLLSLSLFLSLAMMGLDLTEMVGMALPVLVIIALQVVGLVVFVQLATFRFLGRTYDAAVIVAGHCGFGLGATPTALANMESITNRYGPAPAAIFVVLMVGAFFIDIVNLFVIQLFLNIFV